MSSASPLRADHRARRLVARVARTLRRLSQTHRTVYVEERVDEYRGYWESAASILGAEFVPLAGSVWEIRLNGRRTRVVNYVAGSDDSATRRVAGDKLLCYSLAMQQRVPVPQHLACGLDTFPEAARLIESVRGPLVVKPLRDTASGLGITLGVTSLRQMRWAVALASLYSPEILVEQMMPGESYRLLYLDGKLLHAVRRRGLRITGDGTSSVREILSGLPGARVTLGPLELETLAAQGLNDSSVPPAGASVLVSGAPAGGPNVELRTVYDEDATHLISSAVDRDARRVVEAVGSSFAGVDIVTPDPSRSLAQSGGAFLEINTTPGIHHHYITDRDRTEHPVAVAVLRSLLSPTHRESAESHPSFSLARKPGAEITHPFALESL